jgi:hypothetical protein
VGRSKQIPRLWTALSIGDAIQDGKGEMRRVQGEKNEKCGEMMDQNEVKNSKKII